MPSAVRLHDHVVAVYKDQDGLVAQLSAFASQAASRNELIVFVHAFATEKEALDLLRRSAPDLMALVDKQLFLVSFYQDAFEARSGHIDFDHVVRVVTGLLERASEDRRAGLSVFVDASRVYLEAGRTEEWFAFEERLGRRLHHAMALVCAYPEHAIAPASVRERVLLTHLYRFEDPS